jgi:hypothetical protein
MTDQTPAGAREAAARLARLSDEFFGSCTRSIRSMPRSSASGGLTPWSQIPARTWERHWHPEIEESAVALPQRLKLLGAWMQDE